MNAYPAIFCSNCNPGSLDMTDVMHSGVAAKCPSCGMLHCVSDALLGSPGAENLMWVDENGKPVAPPTAGVKS